MKICAIICELNPFHNGHEYLIRQARAITSCDIVLCIMSTSFTQRGEMCVLDKFTRAKHAVLCDADIVLELPAPFSVAPAEIFAKGAIKIISSIPDIDTLVFGSECGDGKLIHNAADILLNESRLFKRVLNENLKSGESYVKSYRAAFAACGGQPSLLDNANDILAVEYVKAIKAMASPVNIAPVQRIGGAYREENLCGRFSSATAIRKNIGNDSIKFSLPSCVYHDLENLHFTEKQRRFEDLEKFALLGCDREELKNIYGCGEGLENKLKPLYASDYSELIAQASGKRYPAARIKRILCANLLKLYKSDCEEFLKSDLYLKPLAVKKEKKDELFSALGASEYPTIVKQRDLNALSPVAKACFDRSFYADRVWDFIHEKNTYDFTVSIL